MATLNAQDILLDDTQPNADRIKAMRTLAAQGNGTSALIDLYMYEHMRMILWDMQDIIEEAAFIAQLDDPAVQTAIIKNINRDPQRTMAFTMMLGRAGLRFPRITPFIVETLITQLKIKPNPVRRLKGILRADVVRNLMSAFQTICLEQSEIVLRYAEELNNFAQDENELEDLRWIAAFALGESGNTEASNILIDYVRSGKYNELRILGAQTLSKNHITAAQPAILEVIQRRNNKHLRSGLTSALENIADASAEPTMLNLLQSDPNPTVQYAAAKVLARLASQPSTFWRGYLQSQDAILQGVALVALANKADAQAVDLLLGALAQDIRGSAWALGKIRDESAIYYLSRAALTKDPQLRSEAAWALRQFDSEEAREALENLLHDDYDKVRLQAALGLAVTNPTRSEQLLIGEVKRGLPGIITYTRQAWALDIDRPLRDEVISFLQQSESADVQEQLADYLKRFEV